MSWSIGRLTLAGIGAVFLAAAGAGMSPDVVAAFASLGFHLGGGVMVAQLAFGLAALLTAMLAAHESTVLNTARGLGLVSLLVAFLVPAFPESYQFSGLDAWLAVLVGAALIVTAWASGPPPVREPRPKRGHV